MDEFAGVAKIHIYNINKEIAHCGKIICFVPLINYYLFPKKLAKKYFLSVFIIFFFGKKK